MLHHFWIFYYVSPTKKKKRWYFWHNHNTIINIRTFTLIYCFQLFHKPLSSFTNCLKNILSGQRIQFRILCFIFIFMSKASSLSGSLCHLLWVCNKDLWHWPSRSHLAFFWLWTSKNTAKYTEDKILLQRGNHF